jgi:hypothetical protein
MTTVAALLLVAQAAGPWTVTPDTPTVGDTVIVWRAFVQATSARVRPLAGTAVLEPLSDPVAVAARGGVIVRYAVALFAPGRHALPMPDVDVLQPGGVSETVPGDTAWITVSAVLPPGDTLPPPRPSLGPLPRGERRVFPVALLVGAALSASAAWWRVRRRRGPPVGPPPAAEAPADAPLDRWLAAGEARAVAAVAADRLRRAIGRVEPRAHCALSGDEVLAVLREAQPDWPLDDIAATLGALERARYAPAIPADLMGLVEQAAALAQQGQTVDARSSSAGPRESDIEHRASPS